MAPDKFYSFDFKTTIGELNRKLRSRPVPEIIFFTLSRQVLSSEAAFNYTVVNI